MFAPVPSRHHEANEIKAANPLPLNRPPLAGVSGVYPPKTIAYWVCIPKRKSVYLADDGYALEEKLYPTDPNRPQPTPNLRMTGIVSTLSPYLEGEFISALGLA